LGKLKFMAGRFVQIHAEQLLNLKKLYLRNDDFH